MEVVPTFEEARDLYDGVVALVPTMGFLHEGHLSLIEAAAGIANTVVMSLYVNPLQFDEEEDLATYPRDEARDLALAAAAGADVVWMPGSGFEPASRVVVAVPEISATMEGAERPGHFQGVATVVARLFAGLQPDVALFGRKDAQQLVVVRAMAEDLSFPLQVLGRPIVRESDGLALSSRNIRLSPEDREVALALYGGMMAAADAVEAGERDAATLEDLVLGSLDAAPGLSPGYASLASQEDASRLKTLDRPAFLAAAASVGPIRLIDSVHFDAVAGDYVPDRGSRLDGPSVLYQEDVI